MMNTGMNMSRKWKKIAMIAGVMGAVATMHFNCAPSSFESASYSSTNGGGGGAGVDVFGGAKESPYALLTGFQVFSTMANVTGQTGAISNTQRQEFDARAGALSDKDLVTNINAPLQLAAVSLAGEMCNGLINRESAANAVRQFFTGVNFAAAPNANSAQLFSDSISRMARAFWGRDINSEEASILSAFYQDFVATSQANAQSTRNLYLLTCSAMLSSTDALTF